MRKRVRLGIALTMCLSMLMMATMVIAMVPAKAHAGTGVNYIYRYWDDTNKTVMEEQRRADCIEFNDVDGDGWVMNSGWYIGRNFTDGDRPKVPSGATVNLILENGIDLRLRDGIQVEPGGTLNIYTHVYDNGTKDQGKLHIDRSEANTAAIGGNDGQSAGNINIYGGIIEVRGGSHNTDGGAAIGGGNKGGAGNIAIYGGTVTAKGGPNAAGIGSGDITDGGSKSGSVKIYGGNVSAVGGSVSNNGGAGIGGGGKGHIDSVEIFGGTVSAIGGANAAGIGGGAYSESGTISISGGSVTATGDSNAAGIGGGQEGAGTNIAISGGTISATGGSTNTNGGAGIGGGGKGNGENITISGGTITKAQGGANAAGIGGGDEGEGKYIKISGGTVNANGGSKSDSGGAGIGSAHKTNGDGTSGGSVEITGGNVTATGGANGAGIGGGENKGGGKISITGGTVKATGGEYAAGIGSGEDGANAGMITISGSSTKIKANGGKYGAGIGGGYYGGRAGSITITNCADLDAYGGMQAAGIGSGKWSDKHSGDYYANAVSVTISGGLVGSYGGVGAAAIGGGSYGPSGRITIEGGRIYAFGGPNGGSGIGSGEGCSESDVETINITIKDGDIQAKAGRMTETNNWNDDPGAAIGTGGCIRDEGDSGFKITSESYFTGNIQLQGGTIRAYSADITRASGTKDKTLNVIGTTSADNRDWFKKGKVTFSGATVYMYPGAGSDAIKQVVKAGADASEGGIVLRDDNAQYQRVTFTMDSDSVGTEREAKQDYRIAVLSGDEAEEYGTNDKLNHSYKLVKVAPAHKHVFTYSTGTTNQETPGDTIIATCVSSDCPQGLNTNPAKLIISAPDHNEYGDGLSADAKIVDASHIGNASVVYYTANSTDKTREGDPLDPELVTVPPKDPGTYWAEITLDGEDVGDATAGENKATAHVVYDIAKTQPTIIKTATVDEGNEPKTIDLSANVQNVPNEASITYVLDSGESLSGKGILMEGSVLRIPPSSQADPSIGSVTVHVNFAGDDNYKPLNDSITVTINKLPRPTVEAADVEFTFGNSANIAATAITPSGTSIDASQISYAVKTDDWGSDSTSGTGTTSENDIISVNKSTGALEAKKPGTAVVTVTVAGVNPTTTGTEAYASATKDVNVTVKGKTFTVNGFRDSADESYRYQVKSDDAGKLYGIEGIYDGQRHGIEVTGVTGLSGGDTATVYYSNKELTADNYDIDGVTKGSGYYNDLAAFKDAGTYTVYYYVTAPNYESVAGSAKVTINPRPVAVTVKAEDKTYDGTTDATVTAAVVDSDNNGTPDGKIASDANSGLVGGESIEISGISGQFADKDAGENKPVFVNYDAVTFFGDNPENYTAVGPTETVTATISKAWAVVMADDVYIPVSDPLPEEYAAYAYGAIEGEELVYTLACSSAQAGVKGEYPITVVLDPEDAPNKNYDVWCINGTLAITQSLSVTASGYTGAYDGQPHGITVDVKTPDTSDISSLVANLTEEEWLELAAYLALTIPDDAWKGKGWTDAQWAAWAESSGLNEALEDFKWAEVYYSTEELTKDNCTQVGSTTNPTFTDAGTYSVSYAVVGFDGEVLTGSKDVVIDKAAPAVTAPTPIAGLYQTGELQELVAAGSAEGGTMEYSLDGESWTQDVPTASEAGSYTVYYRVIGDANHKDTAVKTVFSTIATEKEHVAASTTRMYRLYNPNSGEHFYTASEGERDHLAVVGWRYEGTGWIAPTEGAPVYRLYNPNAGDHHYTMSAAERDMLTGVGWNYEGVGWYSAGDDGVPLWRQYNPNAVAGAHNYTTNGAERDMLISVGWNHEGVGWYGVSE